MSLIEFIGFIISLVAMIFLMSRKVWEERQRRKNPEEFEDQDQQGEILQDFLKSLEMDMKEAQPPGPPPPPPPPLPEPVFLRQTAYSQSMEKPKPERIVADEFQFRSKLDKYKPMTAIERRKFKTSIDDRFKDPYGNKIVSPDLRGVHSTQAYDILQKGDKSPASEVIRQLPSLQNMVILYEVFGPPKSFRKPWAIDEIYHPF